MGSVYAEIELINGGDLALVRRHYIGEKEVKRVQVKALVNLSVSMLVINEEIREQLRLSVVEKRMFRLPDHSTVAYDIVAPVELHFKNRQTTCSAIVLPGNEEPVLGAIPFYDMDIVIDPERKELIVNPDHPDMAQMKMK